MKWHDGRGALPPAGIHPSPWRGPSGATLHNRSLETRTALYRFFAGNDVLLYIGITVDPETRFAQHAVESAWYRLHARVSVEWFATRTEAEAAERAAIKAERPAWNVAHSEQGAGRDRRLAASSELAAVARRRLAGQSPERVVDHMSAALELAALAAAVDVGALPWRRRGYRTPEAG